jgi:hypothetical protein
MRRSGAPMAKSRSRGPGGSVTRTRPLSWGERLGSPAITLHVSRPRSVLLMAGQLFQYVGGAGSSRSETRQVIGLGARPHYRISWAWGGPGRPR